MLNTTDRVQNYRFQEIVRTGRILTDSLDNVGSQLNGRSGRPLTPKQERRIRHKANKAAARLARAEDYTLMRELECAPYLSTPETLSVHIEADTSGFDTAAHKSLTVAELKALAKERGLKGYSRLKKDELVSLLSDEANA